MSLKKKGSADPKPRAKALTPKLDHAPDPTATPRGFDAICARIRQENHNLERMLVRQVVVIADLIAEAKTAYDKETGTGKPGRPPKTQEGIPRFQEPFKQRLARETGLSVSMVEKFLRIHKMGDFQRKLLDENPELWSNFTACLELARTSDPERAVEKVAQLARKDKHALAEEVTACPLIDRARKDKELRGLLKQMADPTEALGGLGPDVPVPAALMEKFPELKPYPTLGDVRKTVEDHRKAKRATAAEMNTDPHPRGVRSIRVAARMGVGPGNEHPVEVMYRGQRIKLIIGIVDVRAPRASLEEALEKTKDTGVSPEGRTHPETVGRHERPFVEDAVVTFAVASHT